MAALYARETSEEDSETQADSIELSIVAGLGIIVEVFYLIKLATIPAVMEIRNIIISGKQLVNLDKARKNEKKRAYSLFNKATSTAILFKFIEKPENIYSKSSGGKNEEYSNGDSDLVNVEVINVTDDFEKKIPRTKLILSSLSEEGIEFIVQPHLDFNTGLLHQEIFMPYLISNYTILLFDQK